MSTRQAPELPPCAPARNYSVELLYDTLPELRATDLLATIWARCPDVQRPEADDGPLRFFHTAHRVDFPDGAVPVQTFVSVNEGFDPAALAPSIKQSWKWRKAKQVALDCHASIVVTDMLASSLDPRVRLELFQRVLDGVMQAIPCVAMHWTHAQQVVDPVVFQEAMARGEYSNLLHGALNVRLFQISGYGQSPVPGGTGDSLMDTLGLSAFGIPDFQCHFHDLEHEEVAKVLYGSAYELFQKSVTVQTGDAVVGYPASNAKWRCSVEPALQPPERWVVDLDPGPLYAAGSRA